MGYNHQLFYSITGEASKSVSKEFRTSQPEVQESKKDRRLNNKIELKV